MQKKPMLLDLFCCAGGAAMGYHRAGFEVVGVDIDPQPNYPFQFIQGDAFEVANNIGRCFDAIHASPPCQGYSVTKSMKNTHGAPRLIPEVRTLLSSIGRVYVIENVAGAKREMIHPLRLCGTQFSLTIFRHRFFESNAQLTAPVACDHSGKQVGKNGFVCMAGRGDCNFSHGNHVPKDHRTKASWQKASGISWMTAREMAQAIPPAFTEFIGKQLISKLEES